MKKSTKILAVLLSLILLIGMLAGCAGKNAPAEAPAAAETPAAEAPAAETPAEGTSEEPAATSLGLTPLAERTTIDLGYFSGALYSAIVYGADQKGWFDEVGIDLNYQSFSAGPAMMEANANWDIGLAGGPGALSGLVGYDIHCIAVVDHEVEQRLYVRPDSAIAQSGKGHIEGYPNIMGTPDDWRGTTWIMPVGTTIYKVFVDTLGKLGLTLDDVTVINMDVSSAKSAFLGGQGDGIGCWNTISFAVADEGYPIAASSEDGSILPSTIVATQDGLTNKFDAIEKFLEVFVKAQDYFSAHHDEYAAYNYETCNEEGVTCTEDSSARFIETYAFIPGDEIIKNALTMVDDANGSGQVSVMASDLLGMMDFFIELGTYTKENRAHILDNNLIDSSVAQAVAADLGIQ